MTSARGIRLVFVQAPLWGVDDPPLALTQIAGCAKHCNQQPRVLDFNVQLWRAAPEDLRAAWDWSALSRWEDPDWFRGVLARTESHWDRCVEDTLRDDPDVVAFSAAAGSRLSTLELARRLKRQSPGVSVMVGGPASWSIEEASAWVREPCVDVGVAGVGEDVVPKLLGLFRGSRRWTPLPGVVVRQGGDVRAGARPVPYTFDLDIAPAPAFEGVDWTLYRRPEQLPISASRGCPWSCHFCAPRGFWGKYSFKSGDRIFGDALGLLRSNPAGRRLRFYDIMANGNADSLSRFADMWREAGDPARSVAWAIQAAPRAELTGETLGRWKAGGCEEIVYGVESGSPGTLALMNKPVDPAVAERVVRDTAAAGIRCVVSLLAGFPGESEGAFEETVSLLRRIRGSVDRLWVAAASAEPPALLARRPESFGSDGGTEDAGPERASRLIRIARELGLEAGPSPYPVAPASLTVAA